MRRYLLPVFILIALLVPALLASGPILAADGKSELSVSGSFVKPKDASTVYAIDLQVAMPIGRAGYVVLGPNLHLDSDDTKQAIGGVLEFNLLGSAKSGPFFGASALYLQKEPAASDVRYSGNVLAGWKQNIGTGAALKVYASAPYWGAERDLSDWQGFAGVLIRI